MRRFVTCHSRHRTTAEKEKPTTSTTPTSRFRGDGEPADTTLCPSESSPVSKKCGVIARRRAVGAFGLRERDMNENIPQVPTGVVDRKRPADLFLQSKFSKLSCERKTAEGAGTSPSELENQDAPCKRRKTALFFEHENDKDIPLAARSLQRVHSLSALETSRSKSPHSPDYITHYSLRTVEKPHHGSHSAFGCISGETLCQLLFSLPGEQFSRKFVLVDCRYPYEYTGGHIKNAINMFDIQDVERFFYPEDAEKFNEVNSKIPIFYCEFSQKRGPSMALELRRQDRTRNEHKYPNVDYKEIYVMDQGYRKFYLENHFVEFCEPLGYVPMIHPNYVHELKRYRFHHESRAQVKTRRRRALFQNCGSSSRLEEWSSNKFTKENFPTKLQLEQLREEDSTE